MSEQLTLERIADALNTIASGIRTQNALRARELNEIANQVRALRQPKLTHTVRELGSLWYGLPGTSDEGFAEFVEAVKSLGIEVEPDPPEASR